MAITKSSLMYREATGMSDEKNIYKPSDIVFVKLSGCWWPGEVQDVSSLPEDVKEDLEDDCIAVVKYFDEDYYEPIYKEKEIFPYNCPEKQDFIEKGMARYRNKLKDGSSLLKKLPEDLKTAQKLTGGSTELIEQLMTATKPSRHSYGDIFSPAGAKRKVELQCETPKGGKRPRSDTPKAGKEAPLSQVAQNTPKTQPAKLAKSTPKAQKSTPVPVPKVVTTTADSTGSGGFHCEYCSFNTNRLNLIILHRKSHTDGVLPIEKKPETPEEKPKKSYRAKVKDRTLVVSNLPVIPANPSDLVFDNLVGASSDNKLTVTVAESSRKRVRKAESPQKANALSSSLQSITPQKLLASSTKRKAATPSKSTNLLGELSKSKGSPSKRALLVKQDPAKSAEIKSKLLADWDDDGEDLARPLDQGEDSDDEDSIKGESLLLESNDNEEPGEEILKSEEDLSTVSDKVADESIEVKQEEEENTTKEKEKVNEIKENDTVEGEVNELKEEEKVKVNEDKEKERKEFEHEIESFLESTVVPDVRLADLKVEKKEKLKGEVSPRKEQLPPDALLKEASGEPERAPAKLKIIAATETEPATCPTESILDTSHLQPVHKTLPVPADFTGISIANETTTVGTVSTLASTQEGATAAVLQQELAVPPPPLVLTQAVMIQDGQIVGQGTTNIDGETYVFVAMDDSESASLNGATFVAYAESHDACEQTYYLDTNSIAQAGSGDVVLGLGGPSVDDTKKEG